METQDRSAVSAMYFLLPTLQPLAPPHRAKSMLSAPRNGSGKEHLLRADNSGCLRQKLAFGLSFTDGCKVL